jgi:hypothetical protein
VGRISNNGSSAEHSFGTTNLHAGATGAVMGAWLKVDAWTNSFQENFHKDDFFSGNTKGWGWQRNSTTDSMIMFFRAHNNNVGASSGPIAGTGWHFYSAYVSSASNFIQTYFDGTLVTNTSFGGGLFTNTAELKHVAYPDQHIGPAFVGVTDLALAEVTRVMYGLARGFSPLRTPFTVKFFAPLFGRASVEADLAGMLTATPPGNSIWTPGPPLVGPRF